MAYSRKNYLKKAIKIQAIYLKYKEPDVTNRFIFRRYIKETFDIAENTFYNYLNVKNPTKQLKKIEEANQIKADKKKAARAK